MTLASTRSRQRQSNNQINGAVQEVAAAAAAIVPDEQPNSSTDQTLTTNEARLAQLKQQVCPKKKT
jgi:hypothetical protein